MKSLASSIFLNYVGKSWKFNITDPTDNLRRLDNIRFNRVGTRSYDANGTLLTTTNLTIHLPDNIGGNTATWKLFKLSSIGDTMLADTLFDTNNVTEQIVSFGSLFTQDEEEPKLLSNTGQLLPIDFCYIYRDEMFYGQDASIDESANLINRYSQQGIESDYYLLVPDDAIDDSEYITLHVATGMRVDGNFNTYDQDNINAAQDTFDSSICYADGDILDPDGGSVTTVPYVVTYPYDYGNDKYITVTSTTIVELNNEEYYLVMLPKNQVTENKIYHLNNMVVGIQCGDMSYSDVLNVDSIQITHQAYLFNKREIDLRSVDMSVKKFIFFLYETKNVGELVPEHHKLDILYTHTEDEILGYLTSYNMLWGYRELASSIITHYKDPYYAWAFKLSMDDWVDAIGFASILNMLGRRIFDVKASSSSELKIQLPVSYWIPSDDPNIGSRRVDVLVRGIDNPTVQVINSLVSNNTTHELTIPISVVDGNMYRVEILEQNGHVVLVSSAYDYTYVDRWEQDYYVYRLDKSYSGSVFVDISDEIDNYASHVRINNRDFIKFNPMLGNSAFLIVFGTIQNTVVGTGPTSPPFKYQINDIVSTVAHTIEPGKGATDGVWGNVSVINSGTSVEVPEFNFGTGLLPYQHNVSAQAIKSIYMDKILVGGGRSPWLPGGKVYVTVYGYTDTHYGAIEFHNAETDETYSYNLTDVSNLELGYDLNTGPIIASTIANHWLILLQQDDTSLWISGIGMFWDNTDSDGAVVGYYLIELRMKCRINDDLYYTTTNDRLVCDTEKGIYTDSNGANYSLIASNNKQHWCLCEHTHLSEDSIGSAIITKVIPVSDTDKTTVCVDNISGDLILIDTLGKVIYNFNVPNKTEPSITHIKSEIDTTSSWNTYDQWLYGVCRDGTLLKSMTKLGNTSTIEFIESTGFLEPRDDTSVGGYTIGEAMDGGFIISDITPNNDSKLYVCRWPGAQPIMSNIVFESPTGREYSFGSDRTTQVNIARSSITSGRMLMTCTETTAPEDKLFYVFDLAMDYITPERLFSESIPHPIATYMNVVSTTQDADDITVNASLYRQIFYYYYGTLFAKPSFLRLSYAVDIPEYKTKIPYNRFIRNMNNMRYSDRNRVDYKLNSNLLNVNWEDIDTYNKHRIDKEVVVSAQNGAQITKSLDWNGAPAGAITVPLFDTGELTSSDETYDLSITFKSYNSGVRLLPRIGLYGLYDSKEASMFRDGVEIPNCPYVRAFHNGKEIPSSAIDWDEDNNNYKINMSIPDQDTVLWIYGNMLPVTNASLDVNTDGYMNPVDLDSDKKFIVIDGFTNTDVGGVAVLPYEYPYAITDDLFEMRTYLPSSLLHKLGVDAISIDTLLMYFNTIRKTSYGPWLST